MPDLEREYGISPNNALTEKERRLSLAAIRYKRRTLAGAQKLQHTLNIAGFGYGGYGLIVTPNASPPADPSLIVETNAGYYLVSGDYFTTHPLYPQAGRICCRAFDGSDYRSAFECAGYYDRVITTNEASNYQTPPEPYWSLVFFAGGAVTRNPDGRIVAVASVDVPEGRRQELHRLILRIKPVGVWAGMLVRYR